MKTTGENMECRVVTAPDNKWPWGSGTPWVFLAGGITDCHNWQKDAIEILTNSLSKGTIFNPRRENFPINDPKAAEEQISWEFKALAYCNIFTIWFSAGVSVQPICMYELGRHLARYQLGRLYRIIIGVEKGYKREQDVLIQTKLVDSSIHVFRGFGAYIDAIREEVENLH